MKTHQVLNNVGETVQIFTYDNSDGGDWYNKKQEAQKFRNRLAKKYHEHFSVVTGCRSRRPFIKKSPNNYTP